MSATTDGPGGMFFDKTKRCQGSARLVVKRERSLSGLTVLDVMGADADLSAFLSRLDRGRLVIQEPVTGAVLFKFRWGSAYSNDTKITVQGMLEHT